MSFLSKCVLIYFCLIKTKTKTLFCFCSVNLDAMLTFNMHQNLNAATKNPAFFSDVLQNFLWLAQTHRNVFISYSNKQYHLLRTEQPNQQHGVLSKATLCVCVLGVKRFSHCFWSSKQENVGHKQHTALKTWHV